MKKSMMTILTMALICACTIPSMTACSNRKDQAMTTAGGAALESTAADITASGSGKIVKETVDGNKAEIANPFIDCKSPDEAKSIAGFGILLPDSVFEGSSAEPFIRAVRDKMIEAVYRDDSGEIRIRKAPGTEDISGVFTEYAESNTITVKEHQVSVKGNEGKASVAVWTDGSYTFSVTADCGNGEGIDSDSLVKIIEGIE